MRTSDTLGGLWTDLPDASAQLSERLATGVVRPEDAARLRHFIDHGWAVIDEAIAPLLRMGYSPGEIREAVGRRLALPAGGRRALLK